MPAPLSRWHVSSRLCWPDLEPRLALLADATIEAAVVPRRRGLRLVQHAAVALTPPADDTTPKAP
jgi:hypothetical protein